MSITLTDGTDTVQLDDDLYWSDEHDWTRIEQAVDRSLTGALIVQAAAMIKGRPITLQPEDDSSAWMYRDTLEQLQFWTEQADLQLTLTLRGTDRAVIFRHQDKPAISARPVVHYNDVVSEDWYLVTLKFMEV